MTKKTFFVWFLRAIALLLLIAGIINFIKLNTVMAIVQIVLCTVALAGSIVLAVLQRHRD